MDIADMADKFIEDQVLTSVRRIREHGVKQGVSAPLNQRRCSHCDTPIPRARVKAVPGCSLCVPCATRQEREQAGIFTATEPQRINAELDDYLLSIC
ncbi:TraR/DksA C4-type zinc finger protein [Sedimenticola thiotaurini]|uniref:Zinc finger DksA/TraR C4-type domain-containing protein n=1 Tax=Sedimenticola thiotaurini TaxID=1543721 RepID=A0A0F7JX09_9GAMM|nr:TraR/DksA C4-type zinc finger protein [Sedimenticola thiotaurini]AKH20127.1 hypothetical protein AAY24_06880 [Sedimenticola thiotaurini]